MNLHDLLNSPKAHHVSGRVVEFRVIGRNQHGEHVQAQAQARFRFVSEEERAALFAKADAACSARYDGKPPADRQIDERNYYVLHAALRDADSPDKPFAATVIELRNALVLEEAQRVFSELGAWLDEEFPASVSEEDMTALIADAKKNSLVDLLTSYGYKRTLTALRSLARDSGKLPTLT